MSARRLPAALWSGILAVLLNTPATAQSRQPPLIVHVSDQTGAPVPAATVTLSSRDARRRLAREADGAGTVRFDDVAEGAYVLEVSAPGFAPAARTIAAPSATGAVAVSLGLSGVNERVVVTAADRLQTTWEVSKAVTLIDGDEIAARHEFTVADALRTVPGTTVQQLGGTGSFTSVKLRGLREQDTAYLIDGVRFRDAASPQGDATAFVGELYIAGLDRIEVLRGSGSSLYGSHAIGGAVNVITRTAAGRPRGGAPRRPEASGSAASPRMPAAASSRIG